MAFDLSFSPEFFFNEGEPYDGGPGKSDQPTSVWQAIESMDNAAWSQMCADVFPNVANEFVTHEAVLEKIQETNTCTDLTSPVEVWIDNDGYHTVKVYDAKS